MSAMDFEPGLRELFTLRGALRDSIRRFFKDRGFIEVDTPVLVTCPGVEVHLGYFSTVWLDENRRVHRLFLRSSPELHMKQALAAGMRKIFQITPCFRNDGERAPLHHPEFTMLEWYETGIGFEDFMTQTEELLRFTMHEMKRRFPGLLKLTFPDKFARLSVSEAFREYAGLELYDQDEELARKARERGISSVNQDDSFESAFFKVLIDMVEPGLKDLHAAVLYDYPPSQAVLAKVEGGKAKRFEFYIEGVEVCNAFLELTDPKENRRRIERSFERRAGLRPEERAGGFEPSCDGHFYRALEKGISPCSGNALGFDRWLSLLLGEGNLDRVIPFRRREPFFPH